MKYKKKIFIFCCICFSVFLIRHGIIDFYVVSTNEMLPTLLAKDYLAVNKMAYGFRFPFIKKYWIQWKTPLRGEVILFRKNDKNHRFSLKRVIGIPGDRLYYSKGKLFINEKYYPHVPPDKVKNDWQFLDASDFYGETIKSLKKRVHWQEELSRGPYSIVLRKKSKTSFGPYKIPPSHYFVMGDHRFQSMDSRTWARDLKKARGSVVFYRKNNKSIKPILIPKSTLLKQGNDSFFSPYFKTNEQALLVNQKIEVPVESLFGGIHDMFEEGESLEIVNSLSTILRVEKEASFYKGQDRSLVSSSSIYGRASLVLWGCKKELPVIKVLCQFGSFRKNRWFWQVHK